MIKHKQNKETPGIYSLPLKRDLFYVQHETDLENISRFSMRITDEAGVGQSEGGDIRSKKGEMQVDNLLGL